MQTIADANRQLTDRSHSRTQSFLPYFAGVPIITMVYTAVLIWLRASGLFGLRYSEAGRLGQAVFKVVFGPPRFIGKLLGATGWWSSFFVVILTGVLWGVVLVWISYTLGRMWKRITQQGAPANADKRRR